MGILNKWTKKKEKEQLAAVEASSDEKKKDAKAKQQAEEAPKSTKKAPNKVVVSGGRRHVIIRPLVSEKALVNEGNGIYTFVVSSQATKIEIKNAIKDLYGVVPATVRTMNYDGKNLRFGRYEGRRSDWKKAVISLPKGQSISIHEGV